VRRLAAVVRQAGEERAQIRVGRIALERDGVAAVELFEVAFIALDLDVLGRARLRCQ
jgi:hypothetical protein